MASFKYKDIYLNKVYSIAGTNENNGKLKNVDRYLTDFYDKEKTIEDCEIKMQKEVLENLITTKTDLIVGGDLMNQITATNSRSSVSGVSSTTSATFNSTTSSVFFFLPRFWKSPIKRKQ